MLKKDVSQYRKGLDFSPGDYVDVCVENMDWNNSNKVNNDKSTTKDYKWNTYKLCFTRYNSMKQTECVLDKGFLLNFEKFDYLFAFSSARCCCVTNFDRGFVYEANFEQC